MEQKVLALITDNYGLGLEESLNLDTPLLELNILDSSAFFDLIEILQAEFVVTVPLAQIQPENFSTARTIANMLGELVGTAAA